MNAVGLKDEGRRKALSNLALVSGGKDCESVLVDYERLSRKVGLYPRKRVHHQIREESAKG
jgi:hypothetical protein